MSAQVNTGRRSVNEGAELADLAGHHPLTERQLRKCGITKWQMVTDIPIAKIDLARSRNNQARVGAALIDSHVSALTTAFENGDEFPPIVLAAIPERNSKPTSPEKNRKEWYIADGNHRVKAMVNNGVLTIPIAYCIDPSTPNAAVMFFMDAANAIHGQGTDKKARMAQAQRLLLNGQPAESVAKALGLPPSTVQRLARHQQTLFRVMQAQIPVSDWEKLHITVRERLAPVRTDEGLRAMVTLALQARLTVGEVVPLVSELNTSSSGAGQQEMVENFRSRFAGRLKQLEEDPAQLIGEVPPVRTDGRNTPPNRLARALGQVSTTPVELPALLWIATIGDDRRQDLLNSARAAQKRLETIIDALANPGQLPLPGAGA